MASLNLEAALRPSAESRYEVRDERFAATGDVIIGSAQDFLVPRLGDRFTVESDGAAHEVSVFMLTICRGGWSAGCRLVADSIRSE